MDSQKNISKCNVRLDITPFLGHEKCTGSEFKAMTERAATEGTGAVASLAQALFLAVAKTLEEWTLKDQHLEEAVSVNTVQSYLAALELLLGSVVRSSFSGAHPVKMTYRYVLANGVAPWFSAVPLEVD